MANLKNFDEFCNENLALKSDYNYYGPGSLDPIIKQLLGEGKNTSIIRSYLTSLGVDPWRIDNAMSEFEVSFGGEKKSVNEAKKIKETFSEKAGKFLAELDKPTFEDAANAFLLGLPGSDEVTEKFKVDKLKNANFKWEFQVKSNVDEKVYKVLSENNIEFGTVHGQLWVMGNTEDEKKKAMEVLNSIGINESEILDEGLALSIAGGIVLGVVGVVAAVNGIKLAGHLAGNIIVKAMEKSDAKAAAKRAAESLGKKKAIIEPIAKKFENDDVLKQMYAELTPYMGTSNAKNRAAAKVRTKEMAAIAKYIKSQLTPEEDRYFTELSKYLRTGAFENNEFYLDVNAIDEKLNKETLQVEEGDGEDIDDMIDDLEDGDEDEYQGPDDNAPDDGDEEKIKDDDSENASPSDKLAKAAKELAKDSKKLEKIKKLLDEEKTNEADTVELDDDGELTKDAENIEDEETGDEVQVEEPAEESVKEDTWTPPAGLFMQPATRIAATIAEVSESLEQANERLERHSSLVEPLLGKKDKQNLSMVKSLLEKKLS